MNKVKKLRKVFFPSFWGEGDQMLIILKLCRYDAMDTKKPKFIAFVWWLTV